MALPVPPPAMKFKDEDLFFWGDVTAPNVGAKVVEPT